MQTESDRVREALSYVPPDDRDIWVRMGMAAKAELGDAGFDIWDAWSQQSESYSSRDAKDVWRSFKDGRVTAGTLFHEATRHGWQSKAGSRAPTPEELAERKRESAERAAREEAERATRHAKTAALADRVLQSIPRRKPDGNPYLERKGVAPVGTLRESTAETLGELLGYIPKSRREALQGRVLVAPVLRPDGSLSTLELIDEAGRKTALTGGRKSGCYWPAQTLPEADGPEPLAIGEGVATTLTGKEVCGLAVAALSSSNLLAVAEAMRRLYPTRPLVILADLVKATGLLDQHAAEAARAIGARLAAPDFGPDRPEGATDMNDLQVLHGVEAVRLAIEQARVPEVEQAEAQQEAPAFPAPEERPSFVVLDDWTEIDGRKRRPGVYFCGMTEAKRDGEPAPFETWVCSPLHVEAVTFDERDNNFGRLLRFRNSLKRWREWSMPMELLAGDGSELRRELLAMGVEIDQAQRSRNLLSLYLQGERPKRRMRCAVQVGWCGSSFVLPDAVFGTDAGGVVFQSGERGHEEFTRGGTLEGWRDGVAAMAAGNTVLMLAVSASFAGPLLGRCNGESGGIHFTGDSSTGKSSALEAACSVWGGVNFKRSWRATANGMEGAASLFNDCLLALDEISEADPREVGAIVYALGNGRGKQRAGRTGAARGVTRWRCMVLSSGEQSIGTAMAAGGFRAKAGQSVRLLDVPAAGKHGAWDELHGHPSGAAFSDALKRGAATHYGHAGRAFLERLTRDERDFCALLEQAKAAKLFGDTGEGQHKRAAARFALIGMAGELATEYSITGWQVGKALAAAAECFRLWQSQRGRGNDERRQILEQVSGFIERHGDARFSSVDSDSEKHPVRDRAGWWRDGDEGREFLLTSEGMHEAFKGFDFKRALDVLQAAGALPAPGANGERRSQLRIAGRPTKVYCVKPERLE